MVRVFSRRILSGVTAVVAPTGKVSSLLRRYNVSAPIYEVPTGLELDNLMLPDGGSAISRESVGLSENDFVMVYLGRLGKEKNISEIISLMKDRAPEAAKLLIVGDGPYRGTLEAQVRQLEMTDRVIFTGMVPPKLTGGYYRLGDVFVSASKSETQGLTYLEAMACGRPLLCRKDECLRELVQNGTNGFVYTSQEEFQSMAQRLYDSAELRAVLGSAAARTIQEGYSKEAFAAKMLDVYDTVLKSMHGKKAS